MKIGIVGAGSIGLLLAYQLAENHQVYLYVRRQIQKDKINASGIVNENSGRARKVTALLIHEKIVVDLLFITVKGNQIPDLIAVLNKNRLHVPIVFLQNGMGHIRYLADLNLPIILGVVEHGAIRKADYVVAHTGVGAIKLANYSYHEKLLEEMIAAINQKDFPYYNVKDWQKLLRDKLIVNAVINPLTAIFEVKNGEILANQSLKQLAKKLCKETAAILNLDQALQWQRIKGIATNTKANTSSMLADIIAKRETEIDAISGYILTQAKIPAPLTEFVYHSIKSKEQKGLANAQDHS